MYIIKNNSGKIIAVSDSLAYQENGNPLIDNGARAIAFNLVGSIEESDTMPDGWTYDNGVYYEPASGEISDAEFMEMLEGVL